MEKWLVVSVLFFSNPVFTYLILYFFPHFSPLLSNFLPLRALFSQDVWPLQPVGFMSIPGVLVAAASIRAAVCAGQETWLMCSWWVTDTGVKREWNKLITNRKGQGHTCPVSSCQIKTLWLGRVSWFPWIRNYWVT